MAINSHYRQMRKTVCGKRWKLKMTMVIYKDDEAIDYWSGGQRPNRLEQ